MNRTLPLTIIAVVMVCAPILQAQTAATGALEGTVKDPTGYSVGGAIVTLTNAATGLVRTAKTESTGVYRITLLPPGTYKAQFEAAGFKVATPPPVTIDVTETHTLDITMQLGSRNETVSVSAESELVQTQNATLGTLVQNRTITELPLTTRNYTQVLSLSPGVVSDVNNAGQLGKGTQDVYVNGASNVNNNFQMDGSDANNFGTGRAGDWLGYTGIGIPNPDAIQEFKIQTTLYDAGYGRNAGANVNVVTKSGSNAFHGSVFEFLRNDVFNANDFFLNRNNQPRPVLKQNQFGGVFGGPINKNRIFFFGAYQGTRQRNGVGFNSLSSNVLPPLTDDRSAATLGSQFCGQTGKFGGVAVACDGSNINPVALKLLNFKLANGTYYIPTPQVIQSNGLGFSVFSIPSKFSENQYMVNTDYVLSNKHTLAQRFFYSPVSSVVAFTSCFNPSCTPGSGGNNEFHNYQASLKLTSLLSNTLVNEARTSFTRNAGTLQSQTPVHDQDVGITPSDPNFPLMPTIAVVGLFSMGGNFNDNFLTAINQFQYADQISWVHGRHSIRTGFQYERVQDNFNLIGPSRGALTFQSFPDFLLGMSAAQNGSSFSNVFASTGIAGDLSKAFRVNDYASFIQDDIKMNSRLTLNAGVRWEINGGISDARGRFSSVWPSIAGTVQPTATTSTLVGFVVPSNSPLSLPAGVTKNSNSTNARNATPLHNFGPRIGFAWQPLASNNRLAVRGGYGIFYTRVQGNAVLQLVQGQPFVSTVRGTGQLNAAATFQVPFTPAPSPGVWTPRTLKPTAQLFAAILAENYDSPMIQEYSLDVQYEVVPKLMIEVGYVGTRGTRLAESRGINEPALASPTNPVNGITTNTTANAFLRVPYLGFGPTGLSRVETYGFSMYDGLQVTARKQLGHGIQFQGAYTWGKDMTDVGGSGFDTVFTGGNVSGDPNDRHQRWAVADYDRTHRFILNYLWDLPHPKSTRVLTSILSGWSFSGVYTVQSGLPITIVDPRGGSIYGFAGTSRAQLCGGFTVAQIATSGGVESRLNNYFNKAAFCAPPAIGNGTGYGELGRGVVRAPGQNNIDTALSKRMKVGGLSESAQLEFRAEFFNALNHPQFAPPAGGSVGGSAISTVGAGNFGQIISTSVAPRLIQFALKYAF